MAAFVAFGCAVSANAADIRAEISLPSPGKAVVSGTFSKDATRLSFVMEYAGVRNLGRRFSDAKAFAADGREVPLRKFSDGEYVSDVPFRGWSYAVDLSGSTVASAASISWSSGETGIINAADILPTNAGKTAEIAIKAAATAVRSSAPDKYQADDIETAVFFVGSGWKLIRSEHADIAVAANRLFTDEDLRSFTDEIISSYSRSLGSPPPRRSLIAWTRPLQTAPPGRWSAQTRGSTITIVSTDMPFASQSVQRLHEQLRHEIFHLWLPAGVELTGNYDWFYEGFALFQSLRLGVELKRIRFADMLATLSKAYNIDRISPGRVSLIEASRSRWAGNDQYVYSRGLLTAFLFEIALRKESGGRRSSVDIVKELIAAARLSPGADANVLIEKTIQKDRVLQNIAARTVFSGSPVDWKGELEAAGLEAVGSGPVQLRVAAKRTRRQNALLVQLGYNM